MTLTLRVYRLGLRKVPAIEVPVLGPAGETLAVTLPPVKVRVLSRLTTEADPALAAAGEPVPVISRNWTLIWILIVVGSLVVAAVLALVIVWWLRRRNRPEPPPPPPRPAHEIALGKLAQIERERLPETGEVMAYYIRVSEAVREYFGNRFGFDGLVLTSFELMNELKTVDLGSVPPARVDAFLEESDLVKFANFDPTAKEIDWLITSAYSLVRDTMPAPIAVETPEPTSEGEASGGEGGETP